MNNFPLYDNLNTEINSSSLTVKEKEEFISQVKIIDKDGRDLVYTLIQYFYLTNKKSEDENDDTIPYNGAITPSENNTHTVKLIYTDFPIRLQRILYKYVKLHQKHVKENLRNGSMI